MVTYALVLVRERQAYLSEFVASLIYIASLRPTMATQRHKLKSNNKKQNK